MKIEDILNRLGKRRESFRIMLDHLSNIENPLIIETGCARQEDNFEGDGMSTLLFDTYINKFGGEFHSVDINSDNVDFARSKISSKSQVHCSDSVKWLKSFSDLNKKVDLLYLDSYDLDTANPHPSSLHHVFELLSINKCLTSNTMICVDDNFSHCGKGQYVKEYFDMLGISRIYDGYQWIWKYQ